MPALGSVRLSGRINCSRGKITVVLRPRIPRPAVNTLPPPDPPHRRRHMPRVRRRGLLRGLRWRSDVQEVQGLDEQRPSNSKEAARWLADSAHTDGCRTTCVASNAHMVVRMCVDHEFPATDELPAKPCGMMWRVDEAWGWALRVRWSKGDFDGQHAPRLKETRNRWHVFTGETIRWVKEQLSCKQTATQIFSKLVLREVHMVNHYVNLHVDNVLT